MSKDNPTTEPERAAWIEANFSAADAELLIVSGKTAGQIALDALQGNGPCPIVRNKPNGSTKPAAAPAAYVDALFGIHQRM